MEMRVTNSSALPLYFNVSQHVGPARANVTDDVLLVQYLLKLCDRKYKSLDFKGLRATGFFDDPTAEAILQFQIALRDKKKMRVTVDGVVSPARGSSVAYGRRAPWTICQLNVLVKDDRARIWPRLQDLPDCPTGLKPKLFQLIIGSLR